MKVRFIDVQTKKEVYQTDMSIIPRIGDLVSPDYPKFGGEVVNVIWILNRYIDDEVIIHYVTRIGEVR